jgi:NADPH:quinone reductase-like Zn-dependent oxidoreductase
VRAVRFDEYGDLDVLQLDEVADPVPGDDEALRGNDRLVTCGGHGGEVVPVDLIELFQSERRAVGSRTRTRAETRSGRLVGRRRDVAAGHGHRVSTRGGARGQARLSARAHYGKVVLTSA